MLRFVLPSKHRWFFFLAAALLVLCCAIARVEAVSIPPQKTASWGTEESPSGRFNNPPSPNQDCIRVPASGGYEVASGRAEWLSRDPIGEEGGLNLYGYVGNDPVNLTDPFGLWAGVDDAIFAAGGALIGMGGRLAGDLLTGNRSTWEDYAGAAVGGAAAGETLLYTANPFLAGAAGGLAANLTTQGLKNWTGKQCGVDAGSAVFDTALGAATGFIQGRPRIPGVNAGRGSDLQVFRQIATKASNGSISNISAPTAAKMARGAFYEYAAGQGAAAGAIGSTIYGSVSQ